MMQPLLARIFRAGGLEVRPHPVTDEELIYSVRGPSPNR